MTVLELLGSTPNNNDVHHEKPSERKIFDPLVSESNFLFELSLLQLWLVDSLSSTSITYMSTCNPLAVRHLRSDWCSVLARSKISDLKFAKLRVNFPASVSRWNSWQTGSRYLTLVGVRFPGKSTSTFFRSVKDVHFPKWKKLPNKPYFFRIYNSYPDECDVLWRKISITKENSRNYKFVKNKFVWTFIIQD